MSIINPIAKIGDVIRGSLLADRPEQIHDLLKSVTDRITALGGKFYIKNFWADPKPLSLGYVGVHIKIRMPIPSKHINAASGQNVTGGDNQKRRYILMELQLHIREIMDGTQDCAKEIAHLLYKAPKEADEKISQEIISSSQLVYLTAMTRLLAPKEKLKKVDQTLQILQEMLKADKKMRLVMATALLLENEDLDGVWNEQLQVVVPKDGDAVATEWMATAKKINELLNLPIVKMDESDWTNTAITVEELYADAAQIAPFFSEMCEQAARSQPGCSVNFGPKDKHMKKEKPSLLDKINADRNEELGRVMFQFLKKIGRTLSQITGSDSICLGSLSELHNLTFSGCSQITDSDLGFLRSLHALQDLNLSDCIQITDEGVAHLEHLTKLRSLNLSGCSITDKALSYLENLTKLKSLNLAFCVQITDRGLVNLWKLNKLITLNRIGCDKITDSGLVLAGLQRFNLPHQNSDPANLRQPAPLTQRPVVSESVQATSDACAALDFDFSENFRKMHARDDRKSPPVGFSSRVKSLRTSPLHSSNDLFAMPAVDEGKRAPVIFPSPTRPSQTQSARSTACKKWASSIKGVAVSSTTKKLANSMVRLPFSIFKKITSSTKGVTVSSGKKLANSMITLPSSIYEIGVRWLNSKRLARAHFHQMAEILTRIDKLSQISYLENLNAKEILDLSNSSITEYDLYPLSELVPNLQSLDLSGTRWVDRDIYSFPSLSVLSRLTALRSLNLAHCTLLTGHNIYSLGCLTTLHSLNLRSLNISPYYTEIRKEDLAWLSNLKDLQNLNLSKNEFRDNSLDSLGSLYRLQNLDLTECEITARDLDKLWKLNLQSLISPNGREMMGMQGKMILLVGYLAAIQDQIFSISRQVFNLPGQITDRCTTMLNQSLSGSWEIKDLVYQERKNILKLALALFIFYNMYPASSSRTEDQ